MSHSRRLSLEPAIDSSRFRDALSLQRQQQEDNDEVNKPDFRELDLGSPVSTLTPRVTSSSSATPTSSSSSSGSVSGKPSVASSQIGKSHSGEISSSGSGFTRNVKPGHRRSASTGTPLIFSGYSATTQTQTSGATSAVSPSPGVLPAGNICPSGRILKTGMATRTSSRTETLCTRTGNYGHGNVVRGGGSNNSGKVNHVAVNGENPEELKGMGNDMYRRRVWFHGNQRSRVKHVFTGSLRYVKLDFILGKEKLKSTGFNGGFSVLRYGETIFITGVLITG